jgi:hypothetical protein
MKIVAAAVMHGGKVYSFPPPARHHTILHDMYEKGIRQDHTTEQGFLTDHDVFVRRKPAAMIARHAKQIPEKKKTDPQDILFSEDLW